VADAAPPAERIIDVPPERLARWFENFAARNGAPVQIAASPTGLTARSAGGAIAVAEAPFPAGWAPGSTDPVAALAAHAAADRLVGVLLVRLGGFAAGVFHGPRLVSSKVGSRHVQGRSAAGGWSQQRFARRRANQAVAALDAAIEAAALVLVPVAAELDALVLGGDRRAVERVLADPRTDALGHVDVEPRFLPVPDPRPGVLRATPGAFRAIRIRVRNVN